MAAFLVSRIIVRDPAKFQEYAKVAGATFAAHGGKLALRGVSAKALIGDIESHVTGIVEFPNLAAIDAWFNSPEYQVHAELRDAIGEAEFIAYEGPEE